VKTIQWLWLLPIFILLGISHGAAQSLERGRWWQSIDIATSLQLSPEEAAELDNAFDAAQLAMIELRGNLAVEETKLRGLLELPEIDEAAVFEQHHKVRDARTAMADERLTFLIATRKIIGRDRFIKLMDIRDLLRRNRHLDKTEQTKVPR
jgi:hypothetical protein